MSYYEFCRQTLQKSAPDLYLLSLMGRGAQLAMLWTLYAFEYELGKIRRSVSEPTLGLIRLQWWRDELEKIKQGSAHSKSELLSALKESRLDLQKLEALINAKEMEIRQERPPETVDKAIDYLQKLHTPLCDLVASIDGTDGEGAIIQRVALNKAIVHVLYNAKPKSLVYENKHEFCQYFDSSIAVKGRNLKAVQAHSNLHFKRLKKYNFDEKSQGLMKPPPFEALRIWTSLIGKW